ncbi:hypothetical protein [Cypionkella sp.]|uniref:hypothetical protein n=1 Tax=Cypionkella sp. TaxID=2811411 RepID=UPI002ABCAD8F|nr:hypothetical protein [Cypionkella sp.]MDZ4395446.1 hypothetical protein [Cypionkella sp.]
MSQVFLFALVDRPLVKTQVHQPDPADIHWFVTKINELKYLLATIRRPVPSLWQRFVGSGKNDGICGASRAIKVIKI